MKGLLRCSRCKEHKPPEAFSRDRGRPRRGRVSECKECARKDYLARRETILARQKRYYRENKEKISQRGKEYRSRPEVRKRAIERAKEAHCRNKYGLTVEEYDAIIARGCAICGDHAEKMHLDHCHATGRVRDALCQSCNHMIGNARDSIDILFAGMTYLQTHSPAA